MNSILTLPNQHSISITSFKHNLYFWCIICIPERQKDTSGKSFHIERGCGKSTDKVSINESICSNNNCNSARIDRYNFANSTATEVTTAEVTTAEMSTTEPVNSPSNVGDNVTGSELGVKLSLIFMTICIYFPFN